MSKKAEKNNLIPYPVIVLAAGGDVDAINTVLKHYESYIAVLATRRRFDEYGNPHYCVDEEFLARVKRTLNTHGNIESSSLLTIGNARIDTAAGKVYIGEILLDLTALEYRLLLTFASNKGQMLTRAQILESIWDAAGNFVEDNTLTVYIKRLREKLGNAATIETVRGLGYRAD